MIFSILHSHHRHGNLPAETTSSTASRIQPQSAIDHLLKIFVSMPEDDHLYVPQLPRNVFLLWTIKISRRQW